MVSHSEKSCQISQMCNISTHSRTPPGHNSSMLLAWFQFGTIYTNKDNNNNCWIILKSIIFSHLNVCLVIVSIREMPRKIGFIVVNSSSHEDNFSAKELMVHAPTVNGWRSNRYIVNVVLYFQKHNALIHCNLKSSKAPKAMQTVFYWTEL